MNTEQNRNEYINIILILMLLGASMLHLSLSFVFLSIIFVMLIIAFKNRKNILAIKSFKDIQMKSFIFLFFIILFWFIQVQMLSESYSTARSNLTILMAIFIGPIVSCFLIKELKNIDSVVRGINYFVIIFSVYYIFKVIVYGLPEDRDSVLGYVSSNYCAAILFMSYPLILYFLTKKREDKNKYFDTDIFQCYIAIVLSLIVVILSGSRTAFPVVIGIFISLVLLKQSKGIYKLRLIAFIGVLALGVFGLYKYIPSVHSLIERAMQGLSGNKAIVGDVRSTVWIYAIYDFKQYNKWIGSGSNIVMQFERPAHNFILEILMTSGYVGLFMYLINTIRNFYRVLKIGNYRKRFFCVQIIIIFCIVAYVQPFFSTAFTCGLIIWISIFAIALDKE